jgi:SAM-dependent MidA family methyltransferase
MILPEPTEDALRQSRRLESTIIAQIADNGGWISFARYMELALYAPGLGYYSGGAHKLGAPGDFVTAPELSHLFGKAVAGQVAQILAAVGGDILEFGPGTGNLAADLLLELERLRCLPGRYLMLDLSAEMRERQEQTLRRRAPHLLARVEWLDRLPGHLTGLILANEVLDAMPVHLLVWKDDGLYERGVGLSLAGTLRWEDIPATGEPARAAETLGVCAPYVSEISLASRAWVAECAGLLKRGALLLIDYGFPEAEYYHPQRRAGTLRCHYRHRVHDSPFNLPGLTDITAHVDFTAVARSASAAGLELLGYTAQAGFLLNCGITEALSRLGPEDSVSYLRAASGVQKLLSPSEMGELFKVIAAGRGIDFPLLGFAVGDRSHRL